MHLRAAAVAVATAGLPLVLAACSRDDGGPRGDAVQDAAITCGAGGPRSDTVQDTAIRLTYGGFGLDLYRKIAAATPGENVFVSPLSAGLAFGMLYNGATGATRKAMQETLGLGDIGTDLEAMNQANLALLEAMAAEDVELAVGNSLWAREGVRFAPDFLARNRAFYRAEVETVDFTAPAAVNRMNEWASRSTKGKIPTVADGPLDPSLVLMLMNAVYFKGRWADEFEPSSTIPQAFHLEDGSTIQTPMMTRLGGYGHLKGDGFSAVRIPYCGGRFAMYVFLPDSGRTLAALRENVNADSLGLWMQRFGQTEVQLSLPRFTARGTYDLVGPLRALGMAAVFDPARAELLAIAPPESLGGRNLFVSRAQQRTFVEVNEEGTEAAAVTSEFVTSDTSITEPPVRFVADRPFFVAIRDDRTRALLFVGQLMDPSARSPE
ncbi:MAG: serpin family protein [Longimicrobiaceae bacterium]